MCDPFPSTSELRHAERGCANIKTSLKKIQSMYVNWRQLRAQIGWNLIVYFMLTINVWKIIKSCLILQLCFVVLFDDILTWILDMPDVCMVSTRDDISVKTH